MKSHIILIASVLLALTSCGTTASFTQATGQQKYQDGIYYRPQSLALDEQAARLTETDELIAKTKSSAVFVKTIGKVDTLLIPENMSAQFKFNHKDSTTTVSLFNDYDLWYDWNWSFSPYRFSRWYDPFWGPSWRYSSWYWGFYDPFWYDPFWGPSWSWGFGPFWGDPFFYSSFYFGPFGPWGYWDPWFYPYGYAGIGYYGGGGHWISGRDHIRPIDTRSDPGRGAGSPRTGIGRVVRTGGQSAVVSNKTVNKAAPASRISTASRTASSAVRTAGNHSSAQRSAGVTRGSSTTSTGVRSASSGSGVSRSTSSSTGTYRRASTPSSVSRGSSTGAVRGSGSYSAPSRSSGSYSSPSRSSSSGSYSAPSRSSGGYSGGSSMGSAGHSAGGYSGSSSGAARGGGGGRR